MKENREVRSLFSSARRQQLIEMKPFDVAITQQRLQAHKLELVELTATARAQPGETEGQKLGAHLPLPQLEWATDKAQRQVEAAITMKWSKNEKMVRVMMEESDGGEYGGEVVGGREDPGQATGDEFEAGRKSASRKFGRAGAMLQGSSSAVVRLLSSRRVGPTLSWRCARTETDPGGERAQG